MPISLQWINKSRKHPVTISAFRDNKVEQARSIGLGNIEGANRPRRHHGRGHVDPFPTYIFTPMLYEMTTAV